MFFNKIAMQRPMRFYIRTISLIVIAFLLVQWCGFTLLRNSGAMIRYRLSNGIFFAGGDVTEPSERIAEIINLIHEANNDNLVLNERKFGPLEPDSVVIVVQVDKDIVLLEYLVKSLSRAKEISKALLVFSHNFYSDDVNELVQTIEFCKVLQIYYPYSLQTHPDQFPGRDPNDCPRNISRLEAFINRCNNAKHPDIFGHYREANFTEKKHHWWWMANRLFRKLSLTKHHKGLFLFLEEDDIVAEDFLFVLIKMNQVAEKFCSDCNAFCLGEKINELKHSKSRFKAQLTATDWSSNRHKGALAFNRATWLGIRSCAKEFCTYDDYDWAKSLEYIAKECLDHGLYVMTVHNPRVFATANWPKRDYAKINETLSFFAKTNQLFPSKFNFTRFNGNWSIKEPEDMRSGEWGDPRDHHLCLREGTN